MELVQRCDVARTGTDGQSQVVGALPGREGHALGERSQHRGIDGIGLVRVCIASAKRLAASGLITMWASPASSRAKAK